MASSGNWKIINGVRYYRISKTFVVGIENGHEVTKKQEFYGKTKKEALAKVKEAEENRWMHTSNKKTIFGVEADKWIKTFFWNCELSDRTKQMYERAWETYFKPLPVYCLPIDMVSLLTLQQSFNTLVSNGVSRAVLKSIYNMLLRFYKYLAQNNMAINVVRDIDLPKRTDLKKNEDITVWTDAELEKIFSNLGKTERSKRLRFLLILAYHTGCRISELLAITYNDICENGLRISKQIQPTYYFDKNGNKVCEYTIQDLKTGNSYRTIPLEPIVYEELNIHREWQNKEARKNGYVPSYVFTTSNGQFYNRNNLTRAANRFYKEIGIDYEGKGFHTYRHTFGTNLCRQGVSIEKAARLMGNTSTVANKYYIRINQEDLKASVKGLSNYYKIG